MSARSPLLAAVLAAAASAQDAESTLYAADPAHPWNRAHAALCARAGPGDTWIGLDTPFALLWASSDYLLREPRSTAAIAALEGLIASAGADVDARARVLMQSDLWAVFDWAVGSDEPAPEERRALALAAARALRALAPSADELLALADPLPALCAAGELPPDLAGAGGPESPWVLLSESHGPWDTPLPIAHAETFQGRTDFAVYLRVPPELGGRAATLAYLAELAEHAALVACEGDCFAGNERHGHLDPAAPAPPEGTMVALVQRLLAFDARGELRVTPIPLAVQLRMFLPVPDDAPPVGARPPFPAAWPYQAFAELRLDRRAMLAGGRALVALGPDERAFDLFAAHGDEVEIYRSSTPPMARPAPLASCAACHGIRGALSLNVFTGAATGAGTHLDIPVFRAARELVEGTPDAHAFRAQRFKTRRYEWGVLRGIWAAGD